MSVENLKAKQAVIDEIKTKLADATSAVVIDYIGTTVEEATAMRKALREAGVDYTVYKNTLMTKAVEGTAFEGLKDVFAGPSALAIGKEDAIAPVRVLAKSMKDTQKMSFKAGIVEGVFYDAEGIKVLSDIPSREVLLAKFLGSIQSPVSKAVRTFQAIADSKAEA